MTFDPPRRAADWAAAGLGADIRGESLGTLVLERPPAADPGDWSVVPPAVDAQGREWLFVEYVPNPDGADLCICFGDAFAAEHADAVERALDFLLTLSGVRRVVRDDPAELLLVGTRDARRIRDALVEWRARAAA